MKKFYPHSDWKKDRFFLRPQYIDELEKAKKVSHECYVNTARRINNSVEARAERGQVTIKSILLATWTDFKERNYSLLQRPGLIDQVERSMLCGDARCGFEIYECERCGAKLMVPHTCKSRFCAKCGKKYRDARSASVCSELLDVPHRQFVFSVPFELRKYFRTDRKRLSVLFHTVEQAFDKCLFENSKARYVTEKRRPGLILFLHTYGRDMKWHPHLHVLVAERFMRKDGTLGNWSYFGYEWMRKTFMYSLLSNLRKTMSPGERHEFDITSRAVKAKFTDGFYVYEPQMEGTSISGTRQLAKYVTRYASHPAISESRIDSFDSETKTVTWHYEPHEDDTRKEEEKLGTQTVTD